MEEKNKLAGHNSYSKLIKFTLPMIFMMIVINIYSIVDGLFVSNLVGTEAFTAVNLAMPFVMILGAIGFMIGTGGSALIARTLGMGNNKLASEIFSMLLEFNIIIGIIMVGAGEALLKPVELMMGASDTTLSSCLEYGRVLIAFIPFLMLQYAFQNFLGVAGKGNIALILTVAAGVTNMLCDFLFIYVFDWGIAGAAYATGLSWLIGGLIPVFYFIFNKKLILHPRFVKIRFKYIFTACYNGLSEMLTNISTSIANIIFNAQLIKLYGNNDGVFSLGIIMYVSYVFAGIFMGYAMGASQITAYNYGAGDSKEVTNVLKKSLIMILISSLVLTGSSVALSYPFTYIFASSDPALCKVASGALRSYSFVFMVSGYNIFASSFFTALGSGTISGLISLLRSMVFQIPMIFILPAIFGKNACWFVVFTSEVLTLTVSFVLTYCFQKKYHYSFFKKYKNETETA